MVVEENEAAANFERVPVVDVHNGNIDVHLPRIMADISASHFVAIDCVSVFKAFLYWNFFYGSIGLWILYKGYVA